MTDLEHKLAAALRKLIQSCGHRSVPHCQFNGCTCGRVELQKVALSDANKLLFELSLQEPQTNN